MSQKIVIETEKEKGKRSKEAGEIFKLGIRSRNCQSCVYKEMNVSWTEPVAHCVICAPISFYCTRLRTTDMALSRTCPLNNLGFG